MQLHIFADASKVAYGAVAFFRHVFESRVKCSFVLGKSRLAPLNLKSLSIPRLELQAAVTATRLREAIIKEVKVDLDSVYLLSDSKTVLKYIFNETTNFGTYVAHRVNEIRNKSKISEWHYIISKLNVADDATRYLKVEELNISCRWFNGPCFLNKLDCKYEFSEAKITQENVNYVNTNTTNTRIDFNEIDTLNINWKYQGYVSHIPGNTIQISIKL